MRRKILPFILGGALAIGAVAPAAAAPSANSLTNALVGVTVQAVLNNVDILNDSANNLITVDINDSFNNLLQNALQNADIDVLNGIEVRIENVLNNLNVNVSDINVEILENGNVQISVLGINVYVPELTLAF